MTILCASWKPCEWRFNSLYLTRTDNRARVKVTRGGVKGSSDLIESTAMISLFCIVQYPPDNSIANEALSTLSQTPVLYHPRTPPTLRIPFRITYLNTASFAGKYFK